MIRLWHGVIAALAAFALVGQAVQILHNGGNLANFFSYFTIESNILVLVAAVLIAFRPDRGGTAFGILRLAGLVGITITGIIFGTILAGIGRHQRLGVVVRQDLPLRRPGDGGGRFPVPATAHPPRQERDVVRAVGVRLAGLHVGPWWRLASRLPGDQHAYVRFPL